MDSKGRPTAADIDDREFLASVVMGPSLTISSFPPKVLRAKAAKLAKRGLLEVTSDNCPRWLTDKGRAMLDLGVNSRMP